MRVRANATYIYDPCLWDIADPKTDLKKGDKVKVVNLHGCPKANTMGCCHVEFDGKFVGLVSTSSLFTEKDYKARQAMEAL